MRPPGPTTGKRLLFWDEQAGELQPLLHVLGAVPGGRKYGQPRDHVRRPTATIWPGRSSSARRSYMGWADCRICGQRLGTRDFFGHGFVWPEMADHYVIVHSVWTKECAEMLAAVRREGRNAP